MCLSGACNCSAASRRVGRQDRLFGAILPPPGIRVKTFSTSIVISPQLWVAAILGQLARAATPGAAAKDGRRARMAAVQYADRQADISVSLLVDVVGTPPELFGLVCPCG